MLLLELLFGLCPNDFNTGMSSFQGVGMERFHYSVIKLY